MSSQERPGHPSMNDLQSALHHDAAKDAKEKLTRNLQNHNLELRKSDIYGVGVFAITQLQKGITIGNFNRKQCLVQNTVIFFILPSNAIDNVGNCHELPEDVVPCCRVCQDDLPINSSKEVVENQS